MHQPVKTHQQTKLTKWFKDIHSKTRAMNVISPESEPVSGDSLRCLQIILSDYTSPEQFAKFTYATNLHRAFGLVFINEDFENFLRHAKLPFSMEMLAARLLSNTQAEIYEIYRVDQNQPIRVKFLANWNLATPFKINTKFIYNRRNNLEGVSLRVGIIENWPVSYEVGNNTWEGFFPSIWHQIEEMTNMTSIKIPSNSTGSIQRNGKWSGLIGMSLDGQIDAIVSELTLDVNRVIVLDFSQPLLKARYQIFFRQPGYIFNWVAVFKPFPLPLWRAILVWAITASLAFFLIQRILRKFRIETNTLSFINCVFFTLQSLSQQGRDKVPRSMACRILFFSSYLVSAVVMPAYSASLISSLTQKTPYRPFNSINEMIAEGTYHLLVANNTAEYDYFANTNDETLTTAYTRHIERVPWKQSMRNIQDGVNTICHYDKYALFGVDAVIARKIFRPPGPPCNIISMTRPLKIIHLGIALPKKHPLHPFIKYQIGLMIERGILSRIEKATWPLITKTTVASWTEVHGEELFPIFTFLFSGILLSVIFLILEIIWHKKQTFLK